MAVIKNPEDLNATNYVATLAFFCCISCVTLMLKFGGFKASLNIFNSKKNKEPNNIPTGLNTTGAYRTNRDEFFGYGRLSEPLRKLTPAMVTLPSHEENVFGLRSTKSIGDLTKADTTPIVQQNPTGISAEPRGISGHLSPTNQANSRQIRNNQDKEQKRLDKQRLAEQKERERAAAKEQAKQEKIREKTRKEAEAKARKEKRKAPQPVQANTKIQPTASNQERINVTQTNISYSTNTLDSSISKSSGPPPYSETLPSDIELNQTATTSSNVTFGKPIDASSWDMISQHRQQLSRTKNEETKRNKQTVMDLKYNFSTNIQENRDNSEV